MSFNVRKIVGNLPDIAQSAQRLAGLSNALPPGVSPEDHIKAFNEVWNSTEDLIGKIMHGSEENRSRIIVQFMRARHGNARKAYEMISKALKWRAEIGIDKYLEKSTEYLSHEKALFPMTVISSSDKCDQPVVYGLIRLLEKKKVDRHHFADAVIAFFEELYYKEEYIKDEMIVILDFRGWSLRRHAPLRMVKDGLTTLQDYYPERLDKVFLVNFPSSIKAAYTAISPIIDSGARNKIIFSSRDATEEMNKHKVSPKSIPTFMGGSLDAKIPGHWPNVAQEWEDPDRIAQNVW